MFREEFRKDKFKFNHDHPDDFTTCFWHKHPKIVLLWIAYRFILTLYFFFVYLSVIFFRPEKGYVWYKNAIYISTLSCLSEFVLFLLAFSITVARYVKEKKNPRLPPLKKMPWHYKTLWFWYNFTAANSVVVTIMFWLFIYQPDTDSDLAFVLATKLFNTVFLIIDYILCSFPFRLLHVYVPCLFPIVYAPFTVIYQFSGGTGNLNIPGIYTITDWRKPLKPFLFVIMYVTLCVFSHCGMCTLYFLKIWLKSRQE